MENASKALIMAASVLISLVIIGALLLMFNNLSNYRQTKSQTAQEVQVIEFNNQYETYNRNNVRGNELYSLLNRVVDYNRRKTTAGTDNDEGQYIAFEPMEISFNFKGNVSMLYIEDNINHLITYDSYTVNGNSNTFENGVMETISTLESGKRFGSIN